MGYCDDCGAWTDNKDVDKAYDDGYEDGRNSQPDLTAWAFENRHNLTSTEFDLLEKVADLMQRGVRL